MVSSSNESMGVIPTSIRPGAQRHVSLGMTWPLVSLLDCRRVQMIRYLRLRRYVGAPIESRKKSPTYLRGVSLKKV